MTTNDTETPNQAERLVPRRAQLLGERDPHILLRWLAEAIKARGLPSRAAMGFHLHSASDQRQRGADDLRAA